MRSRGFGRAVGALLLAIVLAAPAARALDDDAQGWLLATVRGPIAGKWRLYLETQPRVGGDGMRQFLFRPALGYQMTKHWSLWQGYGWTPSFEPDRKESRIFQQSTCDIPHGDWMLPFTLTNRTRLEERFIEDTHGASVRLRHMIRAVYPLTTSERLGLVVFDEPFVTFNSIERGPRSGFDQNRAFVGITDQLTNHIRIEIGYLNQFINARGGADNRMNHIGLLWLDLTL
ncbi:MAG TPA: DUF2490 domain-containing protein [Terriglobales bacterium]|nr:DUF2490 domain-containing protein [Terriglobales bacterium]